MIGAPIKSSHANAIMESDDWASLSDLNLLARVVVEGFITGLHRSPRSGASIEFSQYRPYAQGDDLRFVDWKLLARADRLYLKQCREETNLRCTLLLDCSGSMDYGSGRISKFDYARRLTAALAALMIAQKDAVGLVAFDQNIIAHLPPRMGGAHLQRILAELDRLKPSRKTDAEGALKFLGESLKPRGAVVLVSDLLHPLDSMILQLKGLRARRHETMVFQVSDPAERTFPFDRSATFIDAEDSREMFAIPDAVREAYLANREEHFSRLRAECLASEIDLFDVGTDEPLALALRRCLERRTHPQWTSAH